MLEEQVRLPYCNACESSLRQWLPLAYLYLNPRMATLQISAEPSAFHDQRYISFSEASGRLLRLQPIGFALVPSRPPLLVILEPWRYGPL